MTDAVMALVVAAGEHIGHANHRLKFPLAHLARVNLMLNGKLLDRLVAAKHFQRDFRFEKVKVTFSTSSKFKS